jgi:hypothetical protein
MVSPNLFRNPPLFLLTYSAKPPNLFRKTSGFLLPYSANFPNLSRFKPFGVAKVQDDVSGFVLFEASDFVVQTIKVPDNRYCRDPGF